MDETPIYFSLAELRVLRDLIEAAERSPRITFGSVSQTVQRRVDGAILGYRVRPPLPESMDLLRDMRCQVEYSHVATMPISLYERLKTAILKQKG